MKGSYCYSNYINYDLFKDRVLNGRNDLRQQTGKGVEGSGCDQISGTILALAGRD